MGLNESEGCNTTWNFTFSQIRCACTLAKSLIYSKSGSTIKTSTFTPLIKSSFSTTTHRFLQLKQKIKDTSWFESNKQKHPQLLRNSTSNNCSAVYQKKPTLLLIQVSYSHCLLLFAIEAKGLDLLDPIKAYIKATIKHISQDYSFFLFLQL